MRAFLHRPSHCQSFVREALAGSAHAPEPHSSCSWQVVTSPKSSRSVPPAFGMCIVRIGRFVVTLFVTMFCIRLASITALACSHIDSARISCHSTCLRRDGGRAKRAVRSQSARRARKKTVGILQVDSSLCGDGVPSFHACLFFFLSYKLLGVWSDLFTAASRSCVLLGSCARLLHLRARSYATSPSASLPAPCYRFPQRRCSAAITAHVVVQRDYSFVCHRMCPSGAHRETITHDTPIGASVGVFLFVSHNDQCRI